MMLTVGFLPGHGRGRAARRSGARRNRTLRPAVLETAALSRSCAPRDSDCSADQSGSYGNMCSCQECRMACRNRRGRAQNEVERLQHVCDFEVPLRATRLRPELVHGANTRERPSGATPTYSGCISATVCVSEVGRSSAISLSLRPSATSARTILRSSADLIGGTRTFVRHDRSSPDI